tara:strand:+ start:1232 stop:1420 length:189 start_codon:yes stop_codon:yes gene_type:complete
MKDITERMISYESGELDQQQTLSLFQELINSGLAWQLQGHYGRTATALIDAGLVDCEWQRKA